MMSFLRAITPIRTIMMPRKRTMPPPIPMRTIDMTTGTTTDTTMDTTTTDMTTTDTTTTVMTTDV